MALETKVKKSGLRRIWPYALPALPPIFLIVLYDMLRDRRAVMDLVITNISLPYRTAAAQLSSFGFFQNFSLAEAILTLLVLWAFFLLLAFLIILIRCPRRLHRLGRGLYIYIILILYLVAAHSWMWDVGYHGTDLAEKTGLSSEGVTVRQLTEAAEFFAEKANVLSVQVMRDENGRFDENRESYFRPDKGLYAKLAREFPALDGETYPPKPMLYSKIMSASGFTGVYIALTGETNINVDAPACLTPATIAHEMAHQRGVNSEEEANFAAIAACITSNQPVFEYSGYLLGLTYLSNTLNRADPYACRRLISTLNDAVLQDWSDSSDYWVSRKTAATEKVTAVYDEYLKSNGIAEGVDSYGACVDMLVSWLAQKMN